MPARGLLERRPWLLASLAFAISYWFVADGRLPGLYQMAWKGAGVALLAVYAWTRNGSRDGHLIAGVMALGALGDVLMEIDATAGGAAFFAGHVCAIALYLRHRRADTSVSQKLLAVALLVIVPLLAWVLPSDRSTAANTALYALVLAGMAGLAWTSSFPLYGVGLGALLFVASDVLIFARMGPLAASALPGWLIWPLYYVGQFLICTGVIATLSRNGEDARLQAAVG
ncbi:lysoplasmalogenase family protein [Novosphingobium lentum]|uniref:lysoplasmalogenase family protein n=1 Tax=Novosphingobium lentum TaxID=145287 RepID=UPI00082B4DBC|nr:lysoplasmalogenase family protein [Novosphingobium lentum]